MYRFAIASPRRPDQNVVRRTLPRRLLLLAGLLAAFAPGTPSAAQTASAGSTAVLERAVFAKGLAKNQEPVKPCRDFYPTETVCLSLRLKGRPSKGIVSARFYLGNQLVSDAKIDVAEVNRGVLFSVGSSTYAGFSLNPSKPFPISDKYRVETFFNATPFGTYTFSIVPPVGAIPSKINRAVLAKGVDSKRDPTGTTNTFGLRQPAYLAVQGDLGTGTGVEVNWYANGKLDKVGTKSLTASQNLPATHFYFAFLPAGGWKPGKQEVVLILNGKEAGRYAFTTR